MTRDADSTDGLARTGAGLGLSKRPVEDYLIGAQLMPTVTEGQYSETLHLLREYLSNGIDGHADTIKVHKTGRSLFIYDNGKGMSLDGLDIARGLGVSFKDEDDIGFRGIGIYSGYMVCDNIVITTKRTGELEPSQLVIDVARMKNDLQRAKTSVPRQPLGLKELIYENTLLGQLPPVSEAKKDESYTLVQLENINEAFDKRLSDRTALRRYLLRNLSVDFAPDFEYRAQIRDFLRNNVTSYRPVNVVLEFDGEKPETICRPSIPNLEVPRVETVCNKKGEPIFCYWSCLYKTGEKLPDKYSDFWGFVYKVKNITIGTNQLLERKFGKYSSGGLYKWVTGEIYVLDQNVRPSASRDNFENSEALEQLDQLVSETMKVIERAAFDFQELHRQQEILQECSTAIFKWDRRIVGYADEIGRGDSQVVPFDDYEAISGLRSAVEKLQNNRRKWKVQDKAVVEVLIKRARQLQDYVRKLDVARRDAGETLTGEAEAASGTSSAKPPPTPPPPPPTLKQAVPVQSMLELPDTTAPRSLSQVVDAAGWDISGTCVEVMEIVDASLRDLLGRDSDTYNRLLDKIDERLRWRGRGRKQ
jgi:hypothetical protein